MSESNQSFVLYTSYFEILSDLPNEKLGELFRAILEYKTTKKQPVVSVDLSVVFKFIKNQLDIDEEKYNKKRSKNSNNGSKGGAPRGNQNARKQPKTTQNKHNDNDNVNVNDNVLKKEKIKKEKKLNSEQEIQFELWYQKYPNKKSKTRALTAFFNALKKTSFDTLMSGLNSYIQEIEYKKTEKEYIKHPATWLNQECWNDDYLTNSAKDPPQKDSSYNAYL